MTDRTAAAAGGGGQTRTFPGPADGPSHIDDGAYDRIESFLGRMRSRTDAGNLPDVELRAVQQFVHREARLLDLHGYEAWISLFVDQLIYWVPGTHEAHSLHRTASINFDDRRRLLDRIAYIQTGVQCAQIPPSRTCRMVSNIEGWSDEDSALEVRSNITIWEHRRETNCFVGVQSFRLRRGIDAYTIEMKIIDLVNSIDPQGNNSFII
jgi:3-phenylpropionate/cinnamic acid dioxygenase small subunit